VNAKRRYYGGMVALRTPLIGLLFCAVASLPFVTFAQDEDYWFYGDDFSWVNDVVEPEPAGVSVTQDEDYWFYGDDFSWVNDVVEPEPADVSVAQDEDYWFYGDDFSWVNDVVEPEPAGVSMEDFAGSEDFDGHVTIPPEELFRPYGSLAEPFFFTSDEDTSAAGQMWLEEDVTRSPAHSDIDPQTDQVINISGDPTPEQPQPNFWDKLAKDHPSPYSELAQKLWGSPAPEVVEPAPGPTPWSGGIDPSLTLSGNCLQTFSASDYDTCIDAYVSETNPTFDQRWNSGGLPWTQPPEPVVPDEPAVQADSLRSQWGFDITEEERLAAETPPDTSKMDSPSDKNSTYYGWFFGTRAPYLAKEWGNKTLEIFDIR
jgi:hypothetical protein